MPQHTVSDLRPDPGLPVPPYWAGSIAAAAPRRAASEEAGGGARLRTAAAGYWRRRGLLTGPGQVVAAPGGEPLLLALLVAIGGDAVFARPAAAWHTASTWLLGRAAPTVRTPAEGGGAPDPFALLEAVRRIRTEGGDPRVLVLAAADDPTGTVTPPELLHEVCEAAADVGLVVVSDETYADTVHHHDGTVLLSPAESLPEHAVVVTDLGAGLAPPGWPVAVARFPATDRGAELRRDVVRGCAALRATLPGPVAEAATYALAEPPEVRAHLAAATRLHATVAAAAHRAVTAQGALSRPPEAGFHLYADLGPLGTGLDAPALERRLGQRLGRLLPGGHRFGDDPSVPRVRVDTGPLYGADDDERRAALASVTPLDVPHVAEALRELRAAFAELAAGH
jgi:aspartate aminotransferase